MKKILASLLLCTFAFSSGVVAETTDSGCEHPFIDITGHWAEESICFLYTQDTVEGYSERNYAPDEDVTRAEFLKISLRELGYNVFAVQAYTFTDTNPGDWYYQYITFAHWRGFVSGYDDGSFHPNDPITRAEATVMIMDIAGIIDYDVSDTITSYYDVNADDWFAYAIAVATDYEIIEGYGDGSFRPDDELTRAEAAVIAERVWVTLY